jgi:hypothetical protein
MAFKAANTPLVFTEVFVAFITGIPGANPKRVNVLLPISAMRILFNKLLTFFSVVRLFCRKYYTGQYSIDIGK